MISSPHLATTLLFDVSPRWSLYLNRCVDVLASESLDAPGCQVPFLIKPILAELEGGQYVGPILPMALGDLVSRANVRGGGGDGGGSGGGGGSGADPTKRKSSSARGMGGCRCVMTCTCPPCPFRMGRSLARSWGGRSYQTCTVQFFVRTGTCAGPAGRTGSGNACTSPTLQS